MTAAEARGQDEDEPLALAALRERAEVDVVEWDDPRVPWDRYDRVVLRSTWNYARRIGAFRDWLAAVSQVTDLRNPLPMVLWSLDKHYLADLDRGGVPITPTTFAEPGQTPAFPEGEFVVKPAVGAGSRDAASYGSDDHALALAHVERLNAGVLIQPLLKSVAVQGEWPLVFLAGQYSHAASKRVSLPRAGLVEGLFAIESNTPYTADAEQIAVAQHAVDLVTRRFGVPLYARVDLVRDDAGNSCVLELELVEPSLFLPQAPAGVVGHLARVLQSQT